MQNKQLFGANKQLFGAIGIVFLVLGVFSPLVHMPIVGSLTYFHNGKGDGVYILAVAMLAAYYVFTEEYWKIGIAGIVSLGIILFSFFTFQNKFNMIQAQMRQDLESNPFRGIADMALQSIHFEWGFGLLLLGAILLIAIGFIKDNSIQDTKNKPSKQQNNLNTVKVRLRKVQPHPVDTEMEPDKQSNIELPKKQNLDSEDYKQTVQSKHSTVQKEHPTVTSVHRKNKSEPSFFIKNKIAVILSVLVIAFGIIVFVKNTNTNTNNIIKVEMSSKNEALDAYHEQMGWGKISSNVKIEAVNLYVGKHTNEYSDSFPYPTPVVALAIKNIGTTSIRSFGVSYVVKDIDNKRIVSRTAQASGTIEAGWTSSPLVLSLPPSSFAKLIQKGKPIDFTMSIEVFVLSKDGNTIELYKDILNPNQLSSLPQAGY